jgi:glycosyltransferase involved in cell wall biosynthesis
MTAAAGGRLSKQFSIDDEAYLIASGMLDEAGYRVRAGLSDGVDVAAHHLHLGWRIGLEPNAGFEGAFLRPFYEAAGAFGPPVLTWLDLSALGFRAPSTRAEAEQVADRVRVSDYFDAASYSRRLPAGMDPALHYVVIGEWLGWQPSERFDPTFYRARYEDIAVWGGAALAHHVSSGQYEGRRALPAAARLSFPPLPNAEQRAVLVICHEASRTGAPILGWNLARGLNKEHQVVSVLMRGGELEEDFAVASAAVVGPMTWDEWHPVEMAHVAERLVKTYDPLFAVANSMETCLIVPALAARGVPTVALVHEFTAYVRPLRKMRDVYDWATHVVFPAQLVAQSSFDAFPGLADRRGLHVMSPGRSELPGKSDSRPGAQIVDTQLVVRPPDDHDAFVVLSVGTVHMRKGVDVFLSAAAATRRLAPATRFRFVWIGNGYDPVEDVAYSSYLHEQITRADLEGIVFIVDAVTDLETAYAAADVFFLCSRLDPQPNVGIDALMLGIPTICFEGASGTAELLADDAETQSLVVPHLDAHAAAVEICRLAKDRSLLARLQKAVARVARAAYDMRAYVDEVDRLGHEANDALPALDLRTLAESGAVDVELALAPNTAPVGVYGVEQQVLHQWSVVGTSVRQVANPHFRRPCAGFHPQAYAIAHQKDCGEGAQNPTAHWLRAGRPQGQWSHHVFSPLDPPDPPEVPPRVALHAHFFYPELAQDLAARLADNRTPCDLFISTDTQQKAERLQAHFAQHRGAVEVRVMPNRGRDLGPLLTGFAREISSGTYTVFGHVHGKQSVSSEETMGGPWRDFMWENLIGGQYPIVDLAAAVFGSDPDLGLLMAEDPHLVGWDSNRENAEGLARRMGILDPLPEFFDFPLGSMFWSRPAALRPLLDLGLTWNDYPDEPVAYDGTLLHALERILPFAASAEGLTMASVRVPGSTW